LIAGAEGCRRRRRRRALTRASFHHLRAHRRHFPILVLPPRFLFIREFWHQPPRELGFA
jgi:hypothetical protein